MRAVIIGAGRGSRLREKTDEIPKTLVPVMGRPMLEWILEALAEGGIARTDVIFVAGYRAEVIEARYPEFTYVYNREWESNNILLSLLTAREHLADGFVASYADIVYRGSIVRDVVRAPERIVLGCDTDWRRRYRDRSQHPETDAEKLTADDRRVTRLSRHIAPRDASGEFIGVAKFDAHGAREFVDAFDAARAEFAGKAFREGRTFERAYLIDLFQWMLERGSSLARENMHGGYMEIDTLEDHAHAETWWKESAP